MLDNQTTRCLGRRDDRSLCEKSYQCARHLALRTDANRDDGFAPVDFMLCEKSDSFIEGNDDLA